MPASSDATDAGLRRLIGRGLSGGVLIAANRLLGLAVTMALTRLMLQADYGVYVFSVAAATLIGLPLSTGLPTLVIREVKTRADADAWGGVRGILRHATLIVLAGSVVLVAAGLGIAWRAPGQMVAWAVLLVPVMAMNLVLTGVIRGLDRPLLGVGLFSLVSRIALLALLALAWIGRVTLDPGTALLAHLVSEIVLLAALGLALGRVLPFRARKVAHNVPRGWLGDLVPMTLSGSLPVLNAQAGLVVLGFLGLAEDATLMRIAMQAALLAEIGTVIAVALNAHRFAAGEADRRRAATETARMALIFGLPVALLLAVLARPILGLAFGPAYEAAAPALLILLAAQTVSMLAGPTPQLLNMSRHATVVMWAGLAGAAANIVLCLILVPDLGVEGAAWAFAVSLVIFKTVLLGASIRRLGIDPTPWALATRLGLRTSGR